MPPDPYRRPPIPAEAAALMTRVVVGMIGSASVLGVGLWILESGRATPATWVGFVVMEAILVTLLVSGIWRLQREPALLSAILRSQSIPLAPLTPESERIQIPVHPPQWRGWLWTYGLLTLLALGLAASEAKQHRPAGIAVSAMGAVFCAWRFARTLDSWRRYSSEQDGWIRIDEHGITIPIHVVRSARVLGRSCGTRHLRWEEIEGWEAASPDDGPGVHNIDLRNARRIVLIRSRIQNNRALLDAVRSLGRKQIELADDVSD